MARLSKQPADLALHVAAVSTQRLDKGKFARSRPSSDRLGVDAEEGCHLGWCEQPLARARATSRSVHASISLRRKTWTSLGPPLTSPTRRTSERLASMTRLVPLDGSRRGRLLASTRPSRGRYPAPPRPFHAAGLPQQRVRSRNFATQIAVTRIEAGRVRAARFQSDFYVQDIKAARDELGGPEGHCRARGLPESPTLRNLALSRLGLGCRSAGIVARSKPGGRLTSPGRPAR